MNGGDAEAAELLGDGRGEVPALLDGGEAVEGEAPVAVVVGGARADLVRERLGERDEARAGFGSGCQLERHAELPFSRWAVLRPVAERPVGAAVVEERRPAA